MFHWKDVGDPFLVCYRGFFYGCQLDNTFYCFVNVQFTSFYRNECQRLVLWCLFFFGIFFKETCNVILLVNWCERVNAHFCFVLFWWNMTALTSSAAACVLKPQHGVVFLNFSIDKIKLLFTSVELNQRKTIFLRREKKCWFHSQDFLLLSSFLEFSFIQTNHHVNVTIIFFVNFSAHCG